MKFWKLVLATIALIISTSSNAALINNGTYTTDDATGLDWLDLSITAGQSYNSVLALNSGWRYATNSEVETLHGHLFENFVPNINNGNSDSRYPGAYSEMLDDITKMENLFGITHSDSYGIYSYGMYLDEADRIMLFGTLRYSDETYGTVYDFIWGLDFPYPDPGWEQARVEDGSYSGALLVRATVVPVPSAVWLFGSGLISLISFARRKKA